jgi:hypothetical protein
MHILLTIAAIGSGCVAPEGRALDPQFARPPDKELWYSMRMIGAFNELRCRGFYPQQAKAIYEKRFGARERAIDAAMLAKYGPRREGEGEVLPIGKRCPAYRGAIRRAEAVQLELERRLGITAKGAH